MDIFTIPAGERSVLHVYQPRRTAATTGNRPFPLCLLVDGGGGEDSPLVITGHCAGNTKPFHGKMLVFS